MHSNVNGLQVKRTIKAVVFQMVGRSCLQIAYYVRHMTFDRQADEKKKTLGSAIERRATMLVATSQVTLVASEELYQTVADPHPGTVANGQQRKSMVFQLDGKKLK